MGVHPGARVLVLLTAWLAVPTARAGPGAPGLVRVYLDCSACDPDYIQTVIPFVQFVRDRAVAQVHLLVTAQPTGAGGDQYTASFIGQEGFAGSSDTFRCSTLPNDTADARRAKLARTLALGLARFAAYSPAGEHLSVAYDAARSPAPAGKDPWDHWVFSLGFDSNFSGQKSRTFKVLAPNWSASRVTAAHKLLLSGYSSYSEERFGLAGGGTLANIQRSWGASSLYVKSLGEHWSAGAGAGADSSTFGNIAHEWTLGPAVEFDVFPYSQSTRRQWRFLYQLEDKSVRYREETIYGKTRETLWSQRLTAALEATEPWGSASLSLQGAGYLHDSSKNHLELFGQVSVRVYDGLSLRFSTSYSRVRDQLALPRSGASDQDILLTRQELATQYSYTGSVGFSYSFGSIYTSVVNPRFGR